MRLEATIPDMSGEQLERLAEELNVPRSQLISEAVSLLLTAAMEAKRGRKMAIIEGETQKAVVAIASPSLTQLEWIAHRETLTLSAEEKQRMKDLNDRPPKAAPSLRKAFKKARTRTGK